MAIMDSFIKTTFTVVKGLNNINYYSFVTSQY